MVKQKYTKTSRKKKITPKSRWNRLHILIMTLIFGFVGTAALLIANAQTGDVNSRGALLDQRVGFGRNVTGGNAGPTVHVTSPSDSGPGSLREALTSANPAWIVFDGDYTIKLDTAIRVTSNKTIDGRGRKVIITAPGKTGLILENVSNVIVENLIMTEFGTGVHTVTDTDDAISINASDGIWLDHLDLSRAGDKTIGVTGGTTNMTVSWNRFHDQEQNLQLGAQATGDKDVNQLVTVHHNFFDVGGYRKPVLSFGKAHAYNNYILAWTAYGSRSERYAQLYLENNIYEADVNKAATKFVPGDDGCNDKNTACDKTPGYIKAVGNIELNGAVIRQNEPQLVFSPSEHYPYFAQTADEALKNDLKNKSGWQPTAKILDCTKRPNRKACQK